MVVETLDRPFETWRDGLLEVIPTLDDPERCAVILARLRATAQPIGVTSDDVAWLAALVPSTATAQWTRRHRTPARLRPRKRRPLAEAAS